MDPSIILKPCIAAPLHTFQNETFAFCLLLSGLNSIEEKKVHDAHIDHAVAGQNASASDWIFQAENIQWR